jgi:hypothetical protein
MEWGRILVEVLKLKSGDTLLICEDTGKLW